MIEQSIQQIDSIPGNSEIQYEYENIDLDLIELSSCTEETVCKQQSVFPIGCCCSIGCSNCRISKIRNLKYYLKHKLEYQKHQMVHNKEHFRKLCFNCSSSFHCSIYEDGYFNMQKMREGGSNCDTCQKNHTMERSFRHNCNICNKSFNNCKLLVQHRRSEHLWQKPHQCIVCQQSLHDANNHINKHKRPHICPYCKKRYTSKRVLELHILGVCRPGSEKEFKCNLCPKEFYDKCKFNEHQKFHAKLFTCEHCKKCYSSRKSLKQHSYVHSGDWPYNCRFCKKGLPNSHKLKNHEYFQGCTDSPRRDFKCHLCPKMFIAERILSHHMLSHTGDKPFKCKQCPKQYTTNHNLNLHIIFKHTKETLIKKQFKCDLCDKSFVKQYLLNSHKLTHNKAFQCPICLKVYNTGKYIKEHIKRVHESRL